jgi:eukaryotic-like serine/threonine-protein kinase
MPQALPQNVKLIGRYAILRELRRDRYTVAFLALDPVLNRELVIKAVQLQPAAGQDAAGHERIEQAFMRQAQAAGRLHHPHIVTVFDAGRFKTLGYLALELVDGKLLADLLAEGFKPGFLHAADIVARVADAVEYAHARGVPHGHLTASRIYLHGVERSPKVMGFGGWIDSGVTGDFELAGTQSLLPYFRSELDAQSRRKDVRAIGALLFLLLTGQRHDKRVAQRAKPSGSSAILELRPTAPLALAEIAEGALELDGSRPYRTAAQVRNALTSFLWGNRGAEGLPNAATITGMPARLEVVAGGVLAVPTVATAQRTAPAIKAHRTWRPHLLAIGIAAAAMTAVVLLTHYTPSKGAGADDAVAAKPNTAPPESVTGIPATPPPTAEASEVSIPQPELEHVAVQQASGPQMEPTRSAARTTRFGPAAPSQPPARTAPLPAQGVVAFAVVPWGEIYVNGQPRGTTPPLAQLMLPVGRHTIELRNGARPTFVAQVDVLADRPQQISHRFQ